MEIKCKQCGKTFEMSKEELDWYKEKGFEPPKRCIECRRSRRNKKASDKE